MQTVKHGTNQGWLQGCRKSCCDKAHRAWYATRRGFYYQRGGDKLIVDATPSRERLVLLSEKYGRSQLQLARVLDVNNNVLHKVFTGKQKQVYKSTEDKILGVPLEYATLRNSNEPLLNIAGSARRLQSLGYRGFTKKQISEGTNLAAKTVYEIQNSGYFDRPVKLEVAEKIRDFVNHTMLAPDPEGWRNDHARERARELGWLPFGVWDNIDDPDCEPELEEPEYADPVLQDGVERCRSLAARGFTVGEIADVCGIPRPNLHKIVHGKKKQVTPETAKKIHMGCDQLDVLPDSTGPFAERARSVAKRNGWS
jgi:DNA-binding Xre family transcriptional regulator